MTVIIGAGAAVLALSFGIRSVFSDVVDPISREFGGREPFAISLALQQLVWGLSQPLFGALADKYGDRKALWIGFGLYLAGITISAVGDTEWSQHLGAGVLVGAGIAGTAFGLVLAVVGRASAEEHRSRNLGLVTALGSTGQVIFPLLAVYLTPEFGWRVMLGVMALLILPMALLIPMLRAPTPVDDKGAGRPGDPKDDSALEAIRLALGHPSFLLLVLGFFVCGFHIAFIGVHFPAYLKEACIGYFEGLGMLSIAVIGAMNVVGAYGAGWLGAKYPKPYLLAGIYALRSLVILAFIVQPTVTPLTALLFSAAIGPLWLSTVPLTSGIVASMFGARRLGTLYGVVFLSHQLGSVLGAWLGGRIYDLYGSYQPMWLIAVALGVLSALVHLPVREQPYQTAVTP